MDGMEDARTSGPLSIVVFGATGDLARKKLFAALMHLFAQGHLPERVRIVGFAKSERTDEVFRAYVRELLGEHEHHHSGQLIDAFLARVHYVAGDFTEPQAYARLGEALDQLDGQEGCSHKLYYLATPPELYGTIFEHLARSGLGTPCVVDGVESWVRIAVEKPFGRDLDTAIALDKKLAGLFAEEQIFRIDHYLAKEAIANILAFRFSNAIFEPIWNARYIDNVHISFCENFGIGSRGRFYEDVGALRDIGQNHMLQMLALCAMEDPGDITAGAIRGAREEVLGALALLSPEAIDEKTHKGQYASYREEQHVAADSLTDTYFRVEAHIDNERWRDVPFILEGGKMLGEHHTEIRITFKPIESCIAKSAEVTGPLANEIVIMLYPSEEILVRFFAKKPGFTMAVEPKQFRFSLEEDAADRRPDAYEKLLLDCIQGDQTIFTTSREVENAWRFITPILQAWEGREPEIYADCAKRSEVG